MIAEMEACVCIEELAAWWKKNAGRVKRLPAEAKDEVSVAGHVMREGMLNPPEEKPWSDEPPPDDKELF